MVLIVPEEIDGIKQLEEKIALVDLKTITSETYSREVNLTMPKFKLEQSLQLSEPLKKVLVLLLLYFITTDTYRSFRPEKINMKDFGFN